MVHIKWSLSSVPYKMYHLNVGITVWPIRYGSSYEKTEDFLITSQNEPSTPYFCRDELKGGRG